MLGHMVEVFVIHQIPEQGFHKVGLVFLIVLDQKAHTRMIKESSIHGSLHGSKEMAFVMIHKIVETYLFLSNPILACQRTLFIMNVGLSQTLKSIAQTTFQLVANQDFFQFCTVLIVFVLVHQKNQVRLMHGGLHMVQTLLDFFLQPF